MTGGLADHGDEPKLASRGSWGPDPVRQVYSTVGLLLAAVDDDLQGIYRLLVAQVPGIALTASSRSAVELCARAYWLLDPGIDVRARVARGMTERLVSLREQQKLPQDVPRQTEPAQRMAGITSVAKKFGFQVRNDSKGRPLSIGEPRPTSTEVVELLLNGQDPGFGEVLYRYYSATSHGTLYGITAHLKKEEDPADHHELVAMLEFDPPSLLTTTAGAVLSYQRTIDRQIAIYGWDAEDWKREAIEILRAFRKMITA